VYLAEHRESHQKFAIKAIQKKKVKDYTTFINEINILKVLVSAPTHQSRYALLTTFLLRYRTTQTLSSCMRSGSGTTSASLSSSKYTNSKDLMRGQISRSLDSTRARDLLPSTTLTSSTIYRYCEGGELFHFILERKHLAEREAAMIMHQLLSALQYLHGQNISHRDIKPENFMLAHKNDPTCVKMIDFGLSKDFSGQETMKTMSGSVSHLLPLRNLLCNSSNFVSLTTSRLRSSCKTTTLRLTSGPSE
jgi:serine/threonine protein kinase